MLPVRSWRMALPIAARDLDIVFQASGVDLVRDSQVLLDEVSVTIRSPQWWLEGTDGFHTEITRRPLVPVLGADGAP